MFSISGLNGFCFLRTFSLLSLFLSFLLPIFTISFSFYLLSSFFSLFAARQGQTWYASLCFAHTAQFANWQSNISTQFTQQCLEKLQEKEEGGEGEAETEERAIGLNKSATMRGEKAVSSQIGSRDWTVIERESDEEKRTVNRGQKMTIEREGE